MEPSPTWRHHLVCRSGVATLALSGELDLACAPMVQALLFEQVRAAGVTEVRVDLEQVSFLDSSALGVLVGGLQYAREHGCGFFVVNPSPMARRVLGLTGLDEVLIAG
jgi:anti-sigma B factor antagonist